MKIKFTPLKKLFIGMGLFTALFSQAQVATGYTFSQSTGTFTTITGGTLLANAAMANMDEEVFGPVAIPAFTFDGTVYTSIYISTNGHITFGGASNLYEYDIISGTQTAYNGAICAFCADLDQASVGGAKNIRYLQVGTEFVVQWQNVSRYLIGAERIGFQIRLNSSNNQIKIVYGSTAAITAGDDQTYPEVGLRGPDNTFGVNVNNREVFDVTGAWVNSTAGADEFSTCYFDSNTPGTVPVAGTTFIWTAKPDLRVSGFTFSGASTCYGSTEPVSVTLTNNGGSTIDFSVTPVTITSSVTGPNPAGFSPVTISTGTLAVNASQSVQVSASYDMSVAGGNYIYTASAPLTGDGSPGNNTLISTITNARPAVAYSDMAFCAGVGTALTGTTSVTPYTITASNSTPLAIPDEDVTGVFSTIVISGAGSALASDVTATIGSLLHTYTGDLILTLIAPDGSSADLAYYAGSDADFTNTVFSDLAIDPIWFGDNPFTGTWQPEVLFSGLTGSANGTWKLHIVDDVADDVGTLNNWSLSFPSSNGIASYSWNPATDLSSATDISPVASPTASLVYAVTVTDLRGCTNTDSVHVTIYQLPNVTASSDAPANAVCAGDSVTLNGGNALTYVWTGSVVDDETFAPSVTDTYTVTGTDANGCENTATITVTVNSLPTVAASSNAPTDTVCAGSSVILSGSGADTYAWTGSVNDGVAFTASTTDTYTVTGTDVNGCSDTAMITITVNTLPTVTATADTNAVCAGVTVTLTGGGATSYAWTGSVNDGVAFAPSATDTYTVTGTDTNNCSNTAMITVTVHALPGVTASSNALANTVCAGSSVTLNGSGADTYSWTGSVTDGTAFIAASTDTYTVTGTDANNCTNTAMITITVNTLPTVTASSDAPSNTVCAGDSVILTGGGADTYSWTGSVTNGAAFAASSTDTYTVTGTDANNCSNTAMITVTVNTLPVVDITFATSSYCINDPAITLSGESPAGGSWSGNGVSGGMFDPATAGAGPSLITYTYTDGNGCSAADTSSILVDPCIGVAEADNTFGIVAYPNPATETINLSVNNINSDKIQIEITDITGRVLYSEQIASLAGRNIDAVIDLRSFASGTYLLKVGVDSGIKMLKIVKQ
jgi:subtilisin-like proprotein convertase family protein